MAFHETFLEYLQGSSLLQAVLIGVVLIVIFSIFTAFLKKSLLKKVRNQKNVSNIIVFTKLLNYAFFIFVVFFVISSYSGSLAGLAIGAGLFSAALGWALQRPITGVAAWIMVILKRPFRIGDRIIVGGIRGDVVDITLTHIYVGEIGGLVSGEESSGRIVMVPNSILFEQNIINYSGEAKQEDVLDEVVFVVTFDSDVDKAKDAGVKAAKDVLMKYGKKDPEAYALNYFHDNGMKILVRYQSPAKKLQRISSDVSAEIFKNVTANNKIRFAYPHREIVGKKI